MNLDDLADLVRASGSDTRRRIDGHRNDTNARATMVHGGVEEVRHALGLAETVAQMRRRIEALEAEVARLKRSA